MSGNLEIKILLGEIQQTLLVLERLEKKLSAFESNKITARQPDSEDGMVVAQYLTNYYTCLETIFLRICRVFEGESTGENWHQSLLERMSLTIDEVRPAIVSDAVRRDLLEFLKFRHFSRYYFELEYDWDKLSFLLHKFHSVRPRVREELAAFQNYLRQIID